MGAVAAIQEAKRCAMRSQVPYVIFQHNGSEPAFMPSDWARALLGTNDLGAANEQAKVIGFALPCGRFKGQYHRA